MKKNFNILIADPNPHVRNFLKREMTAEGYEVQLAENGKEVLKRVYGDENINLLILDPDFPDTDQNTLLYKLQNRLPYLPVILHTFFSDTISPKILTVNAVIEKGGSSVEQLKTEVFNISTKKSYLITEKHKIKS